jgi:hypothetical protein
MRDKLGILLMEETDGGIAVQLFAEPEKALESFDNLAGTLTQKPQRATFLNVSYVDKTAGIKIKDLPVPPLPVEERPDGYKLGDGPVKFSEEKK